jgi:hypothetical protein
VVVYALSGARPQTPEFDEFLDGSPAWYSPPTVPPWPRTPVSACSLAVEAAPTWQGIVETADRHGASVIVLGPHRRSRLLGQLDGSVVGAVLAHTDIPVLAIRIINPNTCSRHPRRADRAPRSRTVLAAHDLSAHADPHRPGRIHDLRRHIAPDLRPPEFTAQVPNWFPIDTDVTVLASVRPNRARRFVSGAAETPQTHPAGCSPRSMS